MQKTDASSSIILASESPRRRCLLEQAGLTFTVIPSAIDESRIMISEPALRVRRLAEAKALDVAERCQKDWVIGADTIVVVGRKILGKPESETDARRMLRELSGTVHEVLTGYAICRRAAGLLFSDTVRTEVEFKILTDDEIDWYVSTGEPCDKAGAYAIQGIGAFLVRRINGSYTNVVGLPVCELIEYLIGQGIIRPSSKSSGWDKKKSAPCAIV